MITMIMMLILSSCESVIDLELPNSNTNRLVFEGGIVHREGGNPSTQEIRLTRTEHFFGETNSLFVEDAIVSIHDGSSETLFQYVGEGLYHIENYATEVGTTYTLNIRYQEQEYEASETVLPVVPISNMYTEFETASLFGSDDGYAVKIDFSDPAGVPNYYFWRLFSNGDYIIEPDGSNVTTLIRNDEFFDGNEIQGLKAHDEFLGQLGDDILVEQFAISSDRFDYLFALFTQTGGGDGLFGDPPPASIKGNIRNLTDPNNRALGYFQVASVSSRALTIEE